jgi:hypothetical protein
VQYPTCRGCGAILQAEGARCLICGFDPAAAPVRPAPAPPPAPLWPPPGVGPPPARRNSRAAVILGAAGCLTAIALIAAASFVFLGRDSGPGHPDEWDPRVAGLAAWVADERGLAFDRPVYVDFLTPAEYREEATGGEQTDEPTEAEAKEMQDAVAGLRALGLVEGDVDLEEASDELSDSGTLAFYNHEEERIVVRGTELTPALRVTLVHELTHALQDQHFDLERLDQLEGDRGANLRAVAEGDAGRIEDAYVDQLDEDDQRAYEAASEDDEEAAERLEESVPDILVAFFSAPYIFGDGFVSLLDEAEGDGAVDEVLRRPPATDEPLFDPLTHFEDQAVHDVAVPATGDGAEELDTGDFGSVAWYLMLSNRIDPHAALRAVDGWGGDEYVSYERGGEVCTAIRFQGDTAEDTEQMGDAVELWVATMPAGVASWEREDETVLVRSCDPGEDAASGKRDVPVSDLFALPAFRTAFAEGFMEEGLDRDEARCVSRRLVERLTVAQLTDETAAYFETPEYRELLLELVGTCRR